MEFVFWGEKQPSSAPTLNYRTLVARDHSVVQMPLTGVVKMRNTPIAGAGTRHEMQEVCHTLSTADGHEEWKIGWRSSLISWYALCIVSILSQNIPPSSF